MKKMHINRAKVYFISSGFVSGLYLMSLTVINAGTCSNSFPELIVANVFFQKSGKSLIFYLPNFVIVSKNSITLILLKNQSKNKKFHIINQFSTPKNQPILFLTLFLG